MAQMKLSALLLKKSANSPIIISKYKQAGNGVTVHVVEAIGRRIAAMDTELRGEALAP